MLGLRPFVLFLTFLAIGLAEFRHRGSIDPVTFQKTSSESAALGDYKWTTAYYENMPVDHFAASNDATFSLKYLYNFDHYKQGGPLFFYTGNEGTIEGFAMNTGMMWDLADHFNAAIVFAEHRYYGDNSSIPFGFDASTLTVAELSYLTSEQALADFATLIPYLKANVVNCSDDTPVIAFGGSYGGMLSAWFRMKYPHVVDGAWAASAPLLYFHKGGVAPGAFEHIVQRTYNASGCDVDLIHKGFDLIKNKSQTVDGRKTLTDIFHIDPRSPIQNATDLINYIQSGIDYMAMTDYPYPSSFLTSMPGWPVEAACEFLQGNKTDTEILQGIFQATMVYYNSSKTNPIQKVCLDSNKCGNSATASLGSFDGWDWQECTEILIEMCSLGPPNDFYYDQCAKGGSFNVSSFATSCASEFGKDFKKDYVKVDKVARLYGLNMRAHSRIIFTGGTLDPWNSGSVTLSTPGMENATTREVYVFQIGGSAHHLDLRQPNTCDPETVVSARYQIVSILWCWAYPEDKQCQNPFQQQELPDFVKPNVTDCKAQAHKYPWGQKANLRPAPQVKDNKCRNSAAGLFQSTLLVVAMTVLARIMA